MGLSSRRRPQEHRNGTLIQGIAGGQRRGWSLRGEKARATAVGGTGGRRRPTEVGPSSPLVRLDYPAVAPVAHGRSPTQIRKFYKDGEENGMDARRKGRPVSRAEIFQAV
jgi:hypothetical protein